MGTSVGPAKYRYQPAGHRSRADLRQYIENIEGNRRLNCDSQLQTCGRSSGASTGCNVCSRLGFRFTSPSCVTSADRKSSPVKRRTMFSSKQRNKGKAPMGVDTPQEVDAEETRRICILHFGLERMEAYKTRRVEGVIDVATKTDKDAPTFKKLKLTSGKSDSPPTERIKEIYVSLTIDGHVSPQTSGLLKMVKMDHAHNAQLVKLDKSIPSMIHSAIKTAIKPVVEKLSSLCARADVLEAEVATIMEEIDRQKELISPMDIDLNIPPAGPDSPVANRSPPDD
ncbi:hypothetical protein HAX54_003114 [Datura stramonium]|uniref:Polyprotein protein n=1 Tax=Datura stramonium TaxID=4076 RepID=A0ABS8RU41_DATST|nr:hypothetical protein [Datura stramonium]